MEINGGGKKHIDAMNILRFLVGRKSSAFEARLFASSFKVQSLALLSPLPEPPSTLIKSIEL